MTLSSSEPRRRRVGRGVKRAARAGRSAFLWFVFFSICAVAVLLSAARWWLPSYVERNQTQLIQTIGDNMGIDMQAGRASLQWSRWGPSLLLESLQVALPGVDMPLTLDRVDASLDILKLIRSRQLIVDEVTLRGLAMDISRSADGNWSLALNRGQSSGTGLETAFAAMSRFGWISIEEASLQIRDAVLDQSYAVENIAVIANSQAGESRISIDADLPPAIGGHIRAVATVTGNAQTGFQGSSYASLDRIELSAITAALNARELMPVGEVKDVQLWSTFEDSGFESLQFQLAGDQFALEDDAGQMRWHLDFFSGAGGWQRNPDGWSAWIDDTVFARDGVAWRPGLTTLESRSDALVGAGQLLRIDELRDLVLPWRHLPSVTPVANWLEGSSPSGELALWRLRLPHDSGSQANTTEETAEGGFKLPDGLRLEAVLTDWRNRRFGAVPGIENVDAVVRLDDGRFSLRLLGESSTLDAPSLFRVPLQVDRIAAQIDGAFGSDGLWVVSDDVLIETPHFQLLTRFSANRTPEAEGVDLDVRASIRELDGRYLSNYYPVGVMPEKLQEWLERSLQGGRMPSGELLLVGNTADYPFRGDEGRLDVRLDVEDLSMDYNPAWPALSAMNGVFRLDGIGAYYKGSAAVLDGVLRNVDARIPDLKTSRMSIDSNWLGESETLVSWLREGPLAKPVGRFFQDMEISGPVDLRLSPNFGLRPGMSATISGAAQFSSANLELTGPELVFDKVRATIPFNEKGLLAHDLEGEYLGNPIQVAVATSDDQREIKLEALTVVDLGKWLEDRNVPIADWVDGPSRWDIGVALKPGESGAPVQITFDARSRLQGVQVTAPDPVAKDASVSRSLEVSAEIGYSDLESWAVRYGDDMAISFTARKGEIQGMSIGAGMPEPALPSQGLRARIDWPRADLERWYTVIDRCCIDDDGEGESDIDIYARVDNATWLGAPVGEISVQLGQAGSAVEGRISGDLVDGRFRYTGGNTPIVQADLTRLDVTPLMEAEFEISEAAPSHPRDYPASRISLRELQIDNLRFTDLSISTDPTDNGLVLSELVARSPLYTAQGSGEWVQSTDGVGVSRLDIFAHSNDVGLAVTDMGSVGTLTGGKGQLNLSGEWQGELWAPDLESLVGGITLELLDGRVNDLDPGVGRVFGLLALQTLPQRLSLDFSDLGDGLGYEAVRGEFEIGGGKAVAKALLLEGPVGVVSVVGPIDFLNRAYDQRIVVLPNVGGSLPIIGAFVGGPLTAASVFLADKLLRGMGVDVNQFGRRDYSLTGSFDEPQLDQIQLENNAAQGENSDR